MHTNIPKSLLRVLLQRHHLKYFVETGTADCNTTIIMASQFDKVWTVELAGDRQRAAVKALSKYKNVVCASGGSPEFLRQLMPQLNKPTLFWLDAHWCSGPKLGPECPLLDELAAIGSLVGRHVILIDDARYFINPPPLPHDPAQWPTLQQVKEAVAGWGVKVEIVGDVIVVETAK